MHNQTFVEISRIKYLRVSVTTSCNARCWYCFNEGLSSNKAELQDVEGFVWLINAINKNHQLEVVRFTGGEPLLNNTISQFIGAVKNEGVKRIGLTTNGILLLENIDMLKRSGITDYAVHICEVDDIDYDAEKTKKNMLMLLKSFEKVRFNIVVTNDNLQRIKDLIRFSCSNGVSLLLLDLLKSNSTPEYFIKLRTDFSEVETLLCELKMDMKEESPNSIIYFNENCMIKIVKYYINPQALQVYCTKLQPFKPVLLSPTFDLHICNHFNQVSFSVREAVERRDINLLFSIVKKAVQYLDGCKECNCIVVK